MKLSNDQWFSIEAKDNSRRGYWTGKNKEEACERFGLNMEQCSVKKVIWNGNEFVEVDQAKQEKLL